MISARSVFGMKPMIISAFAALILLPGCSREKPAPPPVDAAASLPSQQVDELVRRSYQYVAMYNVNNKVAIKQGGWNTVVADTMLKDHTMTEIARPNNDTLYISALLDLRTEPIVLEMPSFDSDYVSLMITGYDHYVNVPMTTRLGDFSKAEKMLIYSARTGNYDGRSVDGVTRTFEATGDFVSAVLRVMPHASDRGRFERIVGEMKAVRLMPLSEYLGGQPLPADPVDFPAVGRTDADVFAGNLLEVMQFVLNHTTFDAASELDQALLAMYEPLGVAPGRQFDAAKVARLDGELLRRTAERIAADVLAENNDPEISRQYLGRMFLLKGQMDLDTLVRQSVIGPIGLPATEAAYPPIPTADGAPMNAMHDYVIRMKRDELPPAGAFWSVTLYDMKNGFFIPNDRRKYSVGANAGMKLDPEGGIAIYIAAEQPAGVPEENWLPIVRRDEDIGPIMRIYEPDLEKMKTWPVPTAERIGN